MKVSLDPRVNIAYPGVSFAFFIVPIPEPYNSDMDRQIVEERITSGVRSCFTERGSWENHPFAEAYVEFYDSMGLNGRKLSNPVKQAYRFLVKDYQSKSPVIDLAMEIEYITSISFQIYDFRSIGDGLRIEIASSPHEHIGHDAKVGKTKVGELITKTEIGEVIHCPSLGNAERFSLLPSAQFALLRLMKPPALDNDQLKQAIQKTWKVFNPTMATYLAGPPNHGELKG